LNYSIFKMRFGSTLAILSFCAAVFGKVYFHETFDDDSWEKRWVQSTYKDDFGKFKVCIFDIYYSHNILFDKYYIKLNINIMMLIDFQW